MRKEELRQHLIKRLKDSKAFWSYDPDSIKDISDEILIELVMLRLDIEDINKLFLLYPYNKVKQAWIKNVVAQGESYYVLNKFFAWYYFGMKRPGTYVKMMATRQLNKKLAAA